MPPRLPLCAAGVAVALVAGAVPPASAARPRGARADLVVAPDGSGDATTIQAARDRIPPDSETPRTMLVRKGACPEKVFVRAGHVSIVAADRARARLVFPGLCRRWRGTHPDDWGAAVVNIANGAGDLVLASITVHNDCGGLHGDHDHQCAIRGGAGVTRAGLPDVNAIADGGDTVSLWNPEPGMSCRRIDEATPAGTVIGLVWRFSTGAPAEESQSGAVTWDRILNQPAAWYGSADAARIADTVMAYQRRSGGWPKDVDMARPHDPAMRAAIAADRAQTDSTIDNGATVTQIRLLARVYEAAPRDALKAALLQGLDYLFAAQYPNGGWPQFFPLRGDYSRRITFNDDAMAGVMTLLREVSNGTRPFAFVDAARRTRAADAVDRGIAIVLATQVRVGGALTAWCAQHDEVTLEPRGARAYEHPSLSGRETVGIVSFLMGIDHPPAAVIAAVDHAVAWLRAVRIEGRRLEQRTDPTAPRGFDEVLAAAPGAPPLWARFYEIGTNRPIFSGRDGVVKYDVADIEVERRTGYAWFGSWALNLLEKDYPKWKAAVDGKR